MEIKQPKSAGAAIEAALKVIQSNREMEIQKNPSLLLNTLPLCERCNDSGIVWDAAHIRVRPCQCKLDIRAKLIINRCVPEVFRNAPRLANIKPYENTGIDLEKQQSLLDIFKSVPFNGYFLYGPTGTGKSYVMWALYKEALYAGREAIFTSCRDLISKMRKEEFRRAWDTPDPSLISKDILKANYFGPTHLFIDEWGKASESTYVYDQLFDLVDYCSYNPSQVVLSISTNYNRADFEEVYGAAMLRRIQEVCGSICYGVGESWK